MTMVEPLTKEEKEEHAYDFHTGNPAVYCGTYHKYNNGSLYGMWVDLTTFYDEEDLFEFLHRLHADEEQPEFMFQDYENFPRKFYSECASIDEFRDLYEWINMDEDDRKKCKEYWDEIDESRDTRDILDAFVYEGDANEFYDMLADEMLEQIGNETICDFFDYKKWERECSWDYWETEHYVFIAN